MNKKPYNVIIIGSGPAGLTAALYAGRAGLEPLVIEGTQPGGQLMRTSVVENWPATESIMGPQLMINMKNHAKLFGADFITEDATAVQSSPSSFIVTTSDKKKLHARTLIIATGASPNTLKCPGEHEYWGKGVTTCAICDAVFYKDKKVVVVGGGDTAMENASFLRKFTKEITIIQITDALTASYIMQQRVINDPAIKIIYSSTVTEIKGDGKTVSSVTIQNTKTNTTTELATNGVFISIGAKPNSGLVAGQINLDSHGYIATDEDTSVTSIPGVFVAGDVHDYKYKQAIVAAGEGCKAALDAQRYLENQK
jgi:thioredoxin reductase (NADPH)